jgi:hypothetical protein
LIREVEPQDYLYPSSWLINELLLGQAEGIRLSKDIDRLDAQKGSNPS